MSAAPRPSRPADLAASAGDLGLLAMLLVLAAVLTAAMVMQYGYGELPCPLCLLQRVAMFGICFGLMHHFRSRDRVRGVGLALVASVFLLVVSGRQTLLDICPRPGHEYVGSAVLGLHMPVWAVIVALAAIAALAVQVAVVGADPHREPQPRLARVAAWAGLYVTALCAINLVSAVLQCGFGACHTDGYRLL
jgi:disulfide bond formation protein DsbB